jgi:hypothetical protein
VARRTISIRAENKNIVAQQKGRRGEIINIVAQQKKGISVKTKISWQFKRFSPPF